MGYDWNTLKNCCSPIGDGTSFPYCQTYLHTQGLLAGVGLEDCNGGLCYGHCILWLAELKHEKGEGFPMMKEFMKYVQKTRVLASYETFITKKNRYDIIKNESFSIMNNNYTESSIDTGANIEKKEKIITQRTNSLSVTARKMTDHHAQQQANLRKMYGHIKEAHKIQYPTYHKEFIQPFLNEKKTNNKNITQFDYYRLALLTAKKFTNEVFQEEKMVRLMGGEQLFNLNLPVNSPMVAECIKFSGEIYNRASTYDDSTVIWDESYKSMVNKHIEELAGTSLKEKVKKIDTAISPILYFYYVDEGLKKIYDEYGLKCEYIVCKCENLKVVEKTLEHINNTWTGITYGALIELHSDVSNGNDAHHAVALYVNPTKAILFDPNLGVIATDKKNVTSFLNFLYTDAKYNGHSGIQFFKM